MDFAQTVTAGIVQQLIEARRQKDWSLERLAAAAELHRTTVGLIERGRRSPSLPVAIRLSHALGLRMSDLVRTAEAAAAELQSASDKSGTAS